MAWFLMFSISSVTSSELGTEATNVMQNVELETDNDHSNFEENNIQEEWMILSDFHNSSANFCDTITGFDNSLQYWQLQSDNYSEQQISEMPLL